MVPETVSGFCLVSKCCACPNVNVFNAFNEEKKEKRKGLARNGSGLDKAALIVFRMAPVLFPLPRPIVVAFCIKAPLIDELEVTRALLISSNISRKIVHFKVGQADTQLKPAF